MYINNFVQSMKILNAFNHNYSNLQIRMKSVTSGLKVFNVAQNPSAWAIGQRMDMQIRSLAAASSNAQRSQSMMKVADGAITSTVEILKTLKEKAINAANETLNDNDRHNLQKEIDQLIDQIDDNALVTYNGKYLLDGSHAGSALTTTQTFTNQSLDVNTLKTSKLTDLNCRAGDNLNIKSTDSVTISFVKDGTTYSTTYKVNNTTLEDIFNKANNLSGNNVFDLSDTDGTKTIGIDSAGKTIETPERQNAITIKAATVGKYGEIAGFNISINDSKGNIKKSANGALDAFRETIQPRNASNDTSLTSHIGADANQSIKISYNDMRASSLGLKGSNGKSIDVSTKQNANAAISVIEQALTRAIDAQTTNGAIINRLNYTIDNLTTQQTNLTDAMSTILDADMAKEITEYAKTNILLQATQAMLAQSNANASWFLSLLT